MTAEGPWTIAGTVMTAFVLLFAVVGVAIAIYAEFIAPKRRERKRLEALKHPADAYFVVLAKSHGVVEDGAEQDDNDHYLKEFTLQSFSKTTVHIAIRPRMHFKTTHIMFGCENNQQIKEKPFAIRQENHFTLVGVDKVCIPGEHPDHKITTSRHYQIKDDKTWSVGTDWIRGFTIETGPPGVYQAEFAFIGGEVEGTSALKIRVEDTARIRMSCATCSEPHQIWPKFKR